MAKSLKSVLGGYGEPLPKKEIQAAQSLGPVNPVDLAPGVKMDPGVKYSLDDKKNSRMGYKTDQGKAEYDKLNTTDNAAYSPTRATAMKEDLRSYQIVVRRGTNGKYAAFRAYDNGEENDKTFKKVSGWYKEKSDAQLVAGLKEGAELFEASYSAKAAAHGKDIGKPGKNFSKIAHSAAKKYGSKEAGERVAGAILNKLRHHEELDKLTDDELLNEIKEEDMAITEGKSGIDRYKKFDRDNRKDKRDWQKKGKDVKEEAEPINEISASKLGRYIKAASKDKYKAMDSTPVVHHKASGKPGDGVDFDHADTNSKEWKRVERRHKGINKAIHKLTKESFSEFASQEAPQLKEDSPMLAAGRTADGADFEKVFKDYAAFEAWHNEAYESYEVKELVNVILPEGVELSEEAEVINEDFGASYEAHHEAALSHAHEIIKALNSHKRALSKHKSLGFYHADDMKHWSRSLEDTKDRLAQRAEAAHSNAKIIAREEGY